MDSLVDFSPVDTSKSKSKRVPPTTLLIPNARAAGFININAIRLKKFGMQKLEEGNSLAKA